MLRCSLTSSPPGLTRWSMLKRSSSKHAAKLSERHRPMDCRVKPGNDERRSSRRACAREPSGWRSANLRTAVTAAARFALRRFHSLQEKRKLRRRSADRRRGYCPSHANECCHSPALRARRALKRSALVCRRSAAALAAANERHRSTPARASWDQASSGVTRIWPVHSVQRVASQYRS